MPADRHQQIGALDPRFAGANLDHGGDAVAGALDPGDGGALVDLHAFRQQPAADHGGQLRIVLAK